jgi:hypothetical protein
MQRNPQVSFSEPEIANFAEVKRLATLLYLYSRIDLDGPQEPYMVRITTNPLAFTKNLPSYQHYPLAFIHCGCAWDTSGVR